MRVAEEGGDRLERCDRKHLDLVDLTHAKLNGEYFQAFLDLSTSASALAHWGGSELYLIEDTSQLWDEFCLIRLSVQYRGREGCPSGLACHSPRQQ
jgi:hypothetical protein